MTSLIDVIFLLLLFFMLSSIFTRFSEIDLMAASAGGGTADEAPIFLTLSADRVLINGRDNPLSTLAPRIDALRGSGDEANVLVATKDDVTAQRLTDLLGALRGVSHIRVTVLEAT